MAFPEPLHVLDDSFLCSVGVRATAMPLMSWSQGSGPSLEQMADELCWSPPHETSADAFVKVITCLPHPVFMNSENQRKFTELGSQVARPLHSA